MVPLHAWKAKPLFIQAFKDALNPRITDASGIPVPTPHAVYIDDDIYLDIADLRCFKQAIAASIKAIFILLGKSKTALRQDPISCLAVAEKIHT
jgi:hypothetical protein